MQLLKYPFFDLSPRDTVNRLLLATNFSRDIQEINRSRQLIFAFASRKFCSEEALAKLRENISNLFAVYGQ